MVTTTIDHTAVLEALDTVVDPDIPVLTIADIGILREVEVDDDGSVLVVITPTYSGCPALAVIEDDIVEALRTVGASVVEVRVRHHPVWTTEWLTPSAKQKLVGFGVAAPIGGLGVVEEILCPRCASSDATKVSEFSSTACRSLWVCSSCLEPFDYFKAT
ncbi:MAG: phenylacetate-CoA oxygenase subunit PaaJ [Acidimicrobiia bacterium]|nr:phenylacetate-CoA oxygenase subunit PaaJ [Acidimicrobiia bacterium]